MLTPPSVSQSVRNKKSRQASLPPTPLIPPGRGRPTRGRAHVLVLDFKRHSLMIPAKVFSFVVKSLMSFFVTLLFSLPQDVPLWVAEVAQTPSYKKTAVCKSRKHDIRTHVPLKSRSLHCWCAVLDSQSETYVMQKNDFPARCQPETDIFSPL